MRIEFRSAKGDVFEATAYIDGEQADRFMVRLDERLRQLEFRFQDLEARQRREQQMAEVTRAFTDLLVKVKSI